VPFLKHEQFLRDEPVFRKGENSNDIYFIVKGRINYIYGHNDTVFKTMSVGGYFGDVGVCLKL
jgi:CRP-like cAMP-binding protein